MSWIEFASLPASLIAGMVLLILTLGILLHSFFQKKAYDLERFQYEEFAIFCFFLTLILSFSIPALYVSINEKVQKELKRYEYQWEQEKDKRKEIEAFVKAKYGNYPIDRIDDPKLYFWFKKIVEGK
jgi:competence protein ComGF